MARKGPLRPLIPAFLLFIAGILFEHFIITPFVTTNKAIIILSLSVLIALLLLLACGLKHPRIYLMIFFFLGIFLKTAADPSSSLIELAEPEKGLMLEGVVDQIPRITGSREQVAVRIRKVIKDNGIYFINEKVLLHIYSSPVPLLPGQIIRFRGKVRPFRNFKNPGGFNYELHMLTKGFLCSCMVSDGRYIVPLGNSKIGIIERYRNRVRNLFQDNLTPLKSDIFRILILGEKQIISPELREMFNTAGLGHVLAVSGLHIGLEGWFVFFVSSLLLLRSSYLIHRIDIRKLSALITCGSILLYALISGFELSTKRAMIMAFAYLFSIIIGRENETWSTFALAGIIILGLYPLSLFNISFQFSFGAVAGILWLSPGIYEKTMGWTKTNKRFLKIIIRYLVGLFSVTLSAILILIPIIILYFNQLSLVTIPANLCVIPIMGLWIIPSGILCSFLFPLSKSLSILFLKFGGAGIQLMINTVHFWSNMSYAWIWVPTPTPYEIFIYYAVLFLVFEIRNRKIFVLILLIIISVALYDAYYWFRENKKEDNLEITFLDVGQGNSCFISFPGNKRMIIDGGGFPGSEFDPGRMIIAPFLWKKRISRINYMALTHPQADHLKGLIFIEDTFHPDEFWYNGIKGENSLFDKLMNRINKNNIKAIGPEGIIHKTQISGVKVSLIHPLPLKGYNKRFINPNNNSLVLRFTYKGRSIMITGDIEDTAERYILSHVSHEKLKSDVLLVPHHGSITSCSEDFLEAVNPAICIISSSGKKGFPHPDVIKRLHRRNIKVFETSKHGAITITIKHGGIKIKTFSGILYETND